MYAVPEALISDQFDNISRHIRSWWTVYEHKELLRVSVTVSTIFLYSLFSSSSLSHMNSILFVSESSVLLSSSSPSSYTTPLFFHSYVNFWLNSLSQSLNIDMSSCFDWRLIVWLMIDPKIVFTLCCISPIYNFIVRPSLIINVFMLLHSNFLSIQSLLWHQFRTSRFYSFVLYFQYVVSIVHESASYITHYITIFVYLCWYNEVECNVIDIVVDSWFDYSAICVRDVLNLVTKLVPITFPVSRSHGMNNVIMYVANLFVWHIQAFVNFLGFGFGGIGRGDLVRIKMLVFLFTIWVYYFVSGWSSMNFVHVLKYWVIILFTHLTNPVQL